MGERHEWSPQSVPWWVPMSNLVRFDVRCERCGAESAWTVEIDDATLALDEECEPE